MQMLQNNETDVAVATMTVSAKRVQVADFTIPFWIARFYVVFRKTRESVSMRVSALTHFGIHLCASVVVMTIVIVIWSHLYSRRPADFSVVYEVLYAFFQQGVEERQWPSSMSGRMLWTVIQLAGYITVSIYSAIFISLLTVQQPLDFDKFAELVESQRYSLGYVQGSVAKELTAHLKYLKFSEFVLEGNIQLALTHVCNINHVIIMSLIAPHTLDKTCNHDLLYMPVAFNRMSFMMRRGLPYTHILNHQLLKMHETGHMARLRNQWMKKVEDSVQQVESLKLVFAAPALLVLCLGIVAAAVCLLLERHSAPRSSRH